MTIGPEPMIMTFRMSSRLGTVVVLLVFRPRVQSDVLNSCRRLRGEVVEAPIYALNRRNPLADPVKRFPGQLDRRGRSGVDAVDAPQADDLAGLPPAVTDPGCLVLKQHGHVLERSALGKLLLDDGRSRANGVEPLAGDFRSEEHTSELQSQSNLVCR